MLLKMQCVIACDAVLILVWLCVGAKTSQLSFIFPFIVFLSLPLPPPPPPAQTLKRRNECSKPYHAAVQLSNEAVRVAPYSSQGQWGIYLCPSFFLPSVYLCNFPCLLPSLFSNLTEGCRFLQSGWWSSNSIYSTAQRQHERAEEISRGRGMKTADVREHFLLAEERQTLGSCPDAVICRKPLRLTEIICIHMSMWGHYEENVLKTSSENLEGEKEGAVMLSEKNQLYPRLNHYG